MRYVDVILPLPLDGVFTYAISDELAARAKAGMRVVVPFNKSKRYTAIIVSLHDRKPEFEASGEHSMPSLPIAPIRGSPWPIPSPLH